VPVAPEGSAGAPQGGRTPVGYRAAVATGMEAAAFPPVVRAETARLAEVIATADPDRAVPTCPGWDLRRLARHVGGVHRWATAVVRTGEPVDPGSLPRDAPRDAAGLATWLREGAEVFCAAAGDGPLDRPCWAWGPDRRVRFWARRLAHETLVHRLDAELAAGASPAVVEPAVAVDAIDELFENAAAIPHLAGVRGDGEMIHLHATDTDGEWLLHLGPGGWDVRAEHGRGDVAVRGPAEALLLVVLGRLPATTSPAVEIFGDAAVLERFTGAFRF